MLPLKFTMTPRWFHKINVAAVRTLNAPILLLISILERQSLWNEKSPKTSIGREAVKFRKPSKLVFWGISRFSVHGDIQAVFDSEPPTSVPEEIEDEAEQGPRDVDGAGSDSLEHGDGQVATKSKNASQKPDNLQDLRGVIQGEIQGRLDELELATKRIEGLLVKLADSLGNPVTEETE